ncbi:hypothetical protein DV737_g5683, partial [Chaetothyriales sp. CBS 132003]
MKFSLPVTILFLAAASSAIPFNGADITQIRRRQVPVDQPAMAQGGFIVPYSNPAGKAKRMAKAKRDVSVQEASMSQNGNIVPYANPGGEKARKAPDSRLDNARNFFRTPHAHSTIIPPAREGSMPRSQLKQLKASLREHGVLGPQKSKKQRKQGSQDAQKRLERNAALDRIREQFNPFEVKTQARRAKYDVVSNKETKTLIGRPGVTRSQGEERRRNTLLRELQSRNKVGGLLDRRFGEDDPTLTPEQKAAERFARQNERKMHKSSLFNLEIDSGDEMVLTHGGRSLDFDGEAARDDYDDGDLEAVDDPATGRSKKEVMKEVIAKSKQHKAERQAAKEDDDDLRLELDKDMSELYKAFHSHKPPEKTLLSPPSENEPHMDPARAAMLAGKSRPDAEREYEANIRQMKLDARSQPSTRTKTEDEKAAEQAETLRELEQKRIRRMKGEAESSDQEEEEEHHRQETDRDQDVDDAEAFGLRLPEPAEQPRQLDVEDEDDFVLDDDLIASESEPDLASDQDLDSDQDSREPEDDGDDDFINGLVLPQAPSFAERSRQKQPANSNLAYTYPCPQTHAEFLELVGDKHDSDLSTIVQRIRALYHKGLAQENSAKLARFAQVLLEHIYYRAQNLDRGEANVEFDATEALIRHLHSMAKAQPLEVGNAFRSHLSKISEERSLQLNTGDCIVLTAIGTIFPTSDHFHAVVTPAMLTIARYLGQSSIRNLRDLGIGAYCCTLALQYQNLSNRYVPEVINYIVNAIAVLAPKPMPPIHQPESAAESQPLNVPLRLPDPPLRIINARTAQEVPGKISFRSLAETATPAPDQALTLLHTFIRLGSLASTLWSVKSAYPELIAPLIHALRHLTTLDAHLPSPSISLATTSLSDITSLASASLTTRRPLLLHNHRPLPIPTSYPLFIENYNPDRHYDPDRERAELSKLKAEHKKERKGAMRELRKDANFIAREKLREKKEKDEAYEKKFKRLVAEIQGEEGREGKEYERQKKKRKGRF